MTVDTGERTVYPRLSTVQDFLLSDPLLNEPLPDDSIAGNTTLRDLFGIFYGSPFGTALACSPLRYSENHGYYPTELMRADLGINVDPAGHNFLIAGSAQFVIQHERSKGLLLTPHQISRILFAGGSHDWEEAIVPDIPFGQKTNDDRRNAAFARKLIWNTLYTGILPTTFIDEVLALISHDDNESIEHKIFELAHHGEDYMTSVSKAGRLALMIGKSDLEIPPFMEPEDREARNTALTSLTVIASQRMRLKLLEFAEDGFVYAGRLLRHYENTQRQIDEELAKLVTLPPDLLP